MFTAIAICIIAIITALYFLQERLIFPAPIFNDENVNIAGFQPVLIPTPDGETLLSYYHPSADNNETILVFHGNGDAAAFQQTKAEALVKAGFGVLLAEYRGYGGSTGSPSETGLFIDAIASYAFVQQLSSQPIGLFAHSLGTGVAVHLASKRKIFAVVLESPFDSLQAVAQKQMPWIPMGLFLKHKFLSVNVIGQIDAPNLIIHGTNDNIIPIEHGRHLMQAAPASTEFMEIPAANHNDLASFGATSTAIDFFIRSSKR